MRLGDESNVVGAGHRMYIGVWGGCGGGGEVGGGLPGLGAVWLSPWWWLKVNTSKQLIDRYI